MRVVVVGSGVSGLTSAVALQDSGHQVEIWARRLPPRTTSNVAAAFWYPYRAFPQHLVNRWGAVSLRHFVQLADDGDAGITVRRAYDLSREPQPRPWWGDAVPRLRPVRPDEGRGELTFGWAFEAPVIDMRKYLPWLQHQFAQHGGRTIEREVRRLDQIQADVIVNCAGLGARELCHDHHLVAIRGQIVHVDNPGLSDVLLDEHEAGGIAYVVPRGDDCVLGGTAAEDDEDPHVRPDEASGIIERCALLDPALRDATVTAHLVGFRPGRHEVRLEVEARAATTTIIHNYGHGGAGVTLSWGCAQDVVELVNRSPQPTAAINP